jgi:hypothetical protein
MSRQETHDADFEFYHPETDDEYIVSVEITIDEDDGVWRDRNGEGYPPSSEWWWKLRSVRRVDGGKPSKYIPKWITLGEIDQEVDKFVDGLCQ